MLIDIEVLCQRQRNINKNSVMFQSSKYMQWQDNYLRGAGMEVYTEYFSPAFHGLPFPQAAE